MSIREKTLDSSHPSTFRSHINLARLYRNWQKFEESERLYKQLLEVFEKNITLKSAYLVQVLKEYAALLRQMGRHAEGETLENRAKKIDEATRRIKD